MCKFDLDDEVCRTEAILVEYLSVTEAQYTKLLLQPQAAVQPTCHPSYTPHLFDTSINARVVASPRSLVPRRYRHHLRSLPHTPYPAPDLRTDTSAVRPRHSSLVS